AQQIFEKYWSFNRGYIGKVYDSVFIKKSLAVWEIGAGANMAFRKSLFEQVGYFDERLDVGAAGCSGDSEFWHRILFNGFTIVYSPRAVVYHEHRKEINDLKSQLFNYMRGFAAAALIQHNQDTKAGYKQHLYKGLPRHYIGQLNKGFPGYAFNYVTVFSEIQGLISGILFFRKNRNKPAHTSF
ncbi:MAG: glycosyltransferase family 2 protein, partial [Chitinophagaceae bacterium]